MDNAYIYFSASIFYILMSDREEQFPFQQFIEALQSSEDLKKGLKNIVNGINNKNIYWTYSAVSAIVQLLKNKDQEATIKCRCLQAIEILMATLNYIPILFVQVYALPMLYEIAVYRSKKTDESVAYYFQKTYNMKDSEEMKRLSLEYVQRSVQLIQCGNEIKPQRLVQIQQLKQGSSFANYLKLLKERGVQELKAWKFIKKNQFKDSRKQFSVKLRKFHEQSDDWIQFLLVNLLEQVKTNKKELLQLRQLLPFGEAYMTSAIVNYCEDQLLQMVQNLDLKRKYLGILNELVRNGDIEAIIMIKNSQFLPAIVSHFGKLPGNLGVNQGQNIFPQIKGSKQVKRQFYVDFLRCLETWAVAMPDKFDSEQFQIKQIYNYLKQVKKFKFPQNFNLNRFQKQIAQNLEKNAQRNDKIVQLLQNMPMNKTELSMAKSKFSNILQKTVNLPSGQLQLKIQEARGYLKQLMMSQKNIDKHFTFLNTFKEQWITYLESLDLQGTDEQRLEALVNSGQKCVEDIQSIVPFYNSYAKKKINYKSFQERVKETLDFHNDLSVSIANTKPKDKSYNLSKVKLARSRLDRSKMDKSNMDKSKFDKSKLDNSNLSKSNLGGRQLLQKLKSKSIVKDTSRLNMTKLMERSNILDKSKSKINLKTQNKDGLIEKMNPMKEQQNEQTIQTKKNIKDKTEYKGRQNLQTTQANRFKIQNKLNSQEKQDHKMQHFKVIEEYETEKEKDKRTNEFKDRLNESRSKSNSKILQRRNLNSGSIIEKSIQRSHSSRNSLNNSRKIKQSSLSKKPSRLSHRIVLQTNNEEQLLSKLEMKDERIQINGNMLVKEKVNQNGKELKEEQQFDNFQEHGASAISSIHSNSVLKAFYNSAEKLMDFTEHEQSPKKKKKVNTIEEKDVCIVLPQKPVLVGDYFTETILPLHKQSSEQISKSKSTNITKKFTVQKVLEIVNTPKQQNRDKSDKKELLKQKSHDDFLLNKYKNLSKHEKLKQSTVQNEKQDPSKHENKLQDKSVLPSPSEIKILKTVQVKKNSEISSLQKKIFELQKQALEMKTKIAAKDYELKSIKSVSRDKSQRGFHNFTSTSQSRYDQSQKQSIRNSSVRKTQRQTTKFQVQVQSGFKQYLQRIKGSTFRKSLLKLKCLVHKNDELEIGCVSQRVQKNVVCTLFVTPHRYNLIDFTLGVIHDSNSKIKVNYETIGMIPKKKQQKIQLTIEIIKIPFCLIEIQINYKSDSQYSSNYNRLTLPLSFNKFCQIKPIQVEQNQQKHLQYIRSDNFKLNPKIVKFDKLMDSFPNFSIIPIKKQKNHYMLLANCRYTDSSFNIMIMIQDNQAWIQGFLKQGVVKEMNFLICTLKDILDGGKK